MSQRVSPQRVNESVISQRVNESMSSPLVNESLCQRVSESINRWSSARFQQVIVSMSQ